MARTRILVFGSGSAARRAAPVLERRFEILAFLDNDPARRGQLFFGRPVLSPDRWRTLEFAVVYLASMHHEAIRRQLVDELGLDPRRIRLAPEFAPPPSWRRALWRMRRLGWPADRLDWDLWRLRNRHRGRRAFVIGTGPSLRMSDLDRLHQAGELTLASNKIFLAFPSTRWRPTYYGLQDPDLVRSSREAIVREVPCPLFLTESLYPHFGDKSGRLSFRLLPPAPPGERPGFSFNLMAGACCGRTITYPLLQFAAWLGLREVILVGVDFHYGNLGALAPHAHFGGEQAYKYEPAAQANYFVRDYHDRGQAVTRPDLDAQLRAYEAARALAHDSGRMRILNATRGGRLEVFPRVDFDSLF